MNVKTRRKDEGYLIEVKTSQKAAVVIRSDSGERIYLPGDGGSDSTYYNEDPDYMKRQKDSWKIMHHEKPEKIQVIS